MFSEGQNAELGKPLSRANVKQRSQSGRGVSYIESWHAIAEANRIFGFDGWSRETTELRCVSERERDIGQNKVPGWSVSYIGKVRVTVTAGGTVITREGCGAGHGIDRDIGLAHESAIKEMESDAAKRALMTFGNQFGLALYDKTQENVEDAPRPEPAPKTNGSVAPSAPASEAPPMTPQRWGLRAIEHVKTLDEAALSRWYAKNVENGNFLKVEDADKDIHDKLKEAIRDREREVSDVPF